MKLGVKKLGRKMLTFNPELISQKKDEKSNRLGNS